MAINFQPYSRDDYEALKQQRVDEDSLNQESTYSLMVAFNGRAVDGYEAGSTPARLVRLLRQVGGAATLGIVAIADSEDTDVLHDQIGGIFQDGIFTPDNGEYRIRTQQRLLGTLVQAYFIEEAIGVDPSFDLELQMLLSRELTPDDILSSERDLVAA